MIGAITVQSDLKKGKNLHAMLLRENLKTIINPDVHYLELRLVRVKVQRREARGGSHDVNCTLLPSPSRHKPLALQEQHMQYSGPSNQDTLK